MRRATLVTPALFVSALAAFAALAADPVPTTRISGRVTDGSSGAPIPGATVAVLDRVVVTDAAGRYTLPGIPRTHSISFRVYREGLVPVPQPAKPSVPPAPPPPPRKAWFFHDLTAPAPFVAAAAVGPAQGAGAGKADIRVVPTEGDATQVDFALREVGPDVNGFCRGCHPADERGPVAYGPDPKIPAPAVDEGFYRTHRFEDVHPAGFDIRELIRRRQFSNPLRPEPTAPLVDGRLVTCDSCHTRHLPTPHGRYVIDEFQKGSALCVKCHA